MLLRHEGFRKLCEARDRLRDVADEGDTIEAIAASVGISPFHFIRQFEAVFGVTPHQYRIEARLALARDLLAGGGDSVTDVCMAVGFSSLGSFSALFTRRVGESPSVFRRRMRHAPAGDPGSALSRQPGCFSLIAALPSDRSFREASVET